jgi:NAD(P)-dependent dehydrogenase (short-subunit alcohol dehydrogenase family)
VAFVTYNHVCLNAGVSGVGGPLWTLSEKDWDWVLSVNLWGVIHGIRAFVPKLVAQEEGHVVNTASIAGLIAPGLVGPYVASKHAVVALSEVLARDLQAVGSPVKVSVLCPGFVRTSIAENARRRPERFQDPRPAEDEEPSQVRQMVGHSMRKLVAGGIAPEEIAGRVLDAVREGHFYIRSHPEMEKSLQNRTKDILENRYPLYDPKTLEPKE